MERGAGATDYILATAGEVFNVGGSVIANNIDVRVFDAVSGAFVVSDRANWTNSRFAFRLPRGRYVFEVDENRLNIDSAYFYRKPYRTAPVLVDRDIEIPQIPQETGLGKLDFTARFPCALAAEVHVYRPRLAYTLRAEIVAEDGTRIARSELSRGVTYTPADPSVPGEYCAHRYEFGLSPGRYSVKISVPEWEAVPFDEQIENGGSAVREHAYTMAARTLVWRGSIVDAIGAPVTSVQIAGIDAANEHRSIDFLSSASNGRFEIAYARGWVAEFAPTWISPRETSVRKRFVLDGSVLPPVVVLDDLATDETMDDGMLRIHGNGDRENRYNVLFLAESYTDVRETYTDTNRNGVWDGIVWYDLNGDGVYNGAQDRATIYGSAGYQNFPAGDPSSANEPFADLNGDGMLNVDDPAQFELNARDFMRSLLGSDFWAEHRSAFNAYLFFEPSPQAGSDVTTESGQVSVQRATRYSANLVLPRMIMELDRRAAMTRALAVLPEVDMVVVLVNQTVRTLARGNVTVAQSGLMVWPAGLLARQVGEMGPSHEMGYYVASLCDEYSEFSGVHPLQGTPSIWCPNASYLHDPHRVPWSNWLDIGVAAPTRHLDGSTGIYEGADYYSGGAYRPSWKSTMRDLSPLFNVPSRAALEAAVQARSAHRHPTDASGRCTRLPVNAIHRRDADC